MSTERKEIVIFRCDEVHFPQTKKDDPDSGEVGYDLRLRVGPDGIPQYWNPIEERWEYFWPNPGPETPPETPDTSRTHFSTDEEYISGTLDVFKNGLLMLEGSGNDFEETGSLLGYDFTTAPRTGDVIKHDYDKPVGFGFVSQIFNEEPQNQQPASDGSVRTFTTKKTFTAGSLVVSYNGRDMVSGSDFNEDSGLQAYTFLWPPRGGYLAHDYSRPITNSTLNRNTDRQPTESPDGSRRNFSTAQKYRAGELRVFLNGVRRFAENDDFTEDADHEGYTFTRPPLTGNIVQHRYTVEIEALETDTETAAGETVAADTVPAETPNGIITVFSTTSNYKTNKLDVFRHGVRLTKGGSPQGFTEGPAANQYTVTGFVPSAAGEMSHRYVLDS